MKTKPIGVRFDPEKLDFIKSQEKVKTNQQVVDFLVNKYWWENKVPTPTHKESPPLHLKEEDGKVVYATPQEVYDAPKLPAGFSGDEPLSFAKMEQQMTGGDSFQELLNGMAGLVFPDEKEEYERKIRSAKHLSPKQINLLLQNLRQ